MVSGRVIRGCECLLMARRLLTSRRYADESSATDEAWTESAVGHFRCSEAAANDLFLHEGAGAVAVRWVSVSPPGCESRGFWDEVKPSHRQWIYAALMLDGLLRSEA